MNCSRWIRNPMAAVTRLLGVGAMDMDWLGWRCLLQIDRARKTMLDSALLVWETSPRRQTNRPTITRDVCLCPLHTTPTPTTLHRNQAAFPSPTQARNIQSPVKPLQTDPSPPPTDATPTPIPRIPPVLELPRQPKAPHLPAQIQQPGTSPPQTEPSPLLGPQSETKTKTERGR